MDFIIEVVGEILPYAIFVAMLAIGDAYGRRRDFHEYEQRRRSYSEWRIRNL